MKLRKWYYYIITSIFIVNYIILYYMLFTLFVSTSNVHILMYSIYYLHCETELRFYIMLFIIYE